MQTTQLNGLRVTLGTPRVVSEAVGNHWFPSMNRFSTGEILLCRSLIPDSNENLIDMHAVTISRDGGETWDKPYPVPGFLGGMTNRLALADGSMLELEDFMYPDPPGQWRNFVMHAVTYLDGGRRYVFEPNAVRLEGLPRDVAPSPFEGKWSRRWQVQACPWGPILDSDGGHLMIVYGHSQEMPTRYDVDVFRSTDNGRLWRYHGTIARGDAVPDGKEGVDETSMVRLADGDLMAVLRVGGGADQYLARAYSHDEGRTWSALDRLPAWSVAPAMRRLSNGVIALSTGRPGIYLWLSADPRGKEWQPIDVQDYHNNVMGPAHNIRVHYKGYHGDDEPVQTTSYTDLIEVAPNRLLLTYDRVPFGWKEVPVDSDERNRIYVLNIDIERA